MQCSLTQSPLALIRQKICKYFLYQKLNRKNPIFIEGLFKSDFIVCKLYSFKIIYDNMIIIKQLKATKFVVPCQVISMSMSTSIPGPAADAKANDNAINKVLKYNFIVFLLFSDF